MKGDSVMRKKMLWICVETAYKDQDVSEEMETWYQEKEQTSNNMRKQCCQGSVWKDSCVCGLKSTLV